MWERRSKESAVDTVETARGRCVAVDAVGAEELDGIEPWQVGATAWKHWMRMAEDARAVAKVSSFVFFQLMR